MNPPSSFHKNLKKRLKAKDAQKKTKTSSEPPCWIYGLHACLKALKNPHRRILRLVCLTGSEETFRSVFLEHHIDLSALPLPLEPVPLSTLTSLLPKDAVHQKIALYAKPLSALSLDHFLAQKSGPCTFVCLDQVTDPHNVGAIIRSCAAFEIDGLCLTDRHSPETGLLAKAASGALEHVEIFRIPNLSQTLQSFKDHGFWCLGLAEEAPIFLGDYDIPQRVVFVLGSEGSGLRVLTRKSCDVLIKIPTSPQFPTLNVSVAAGVCLYENNRHQQRIKEPV